MKLRRLTLATALGGAGHRAHRPADPALRRRPPRPVPNKGDTAWMLISTILVLMMIVPGLALFYGGLVRTKNMLSVLTQVFAIACLVAIIWVIYGYSSPSPTAAASTTSSAASRRPSSPGVDPTSIAATFSNGVVIPEYVYICFQMTFA